MSTMFSRELLEAEELLKKVRSWTDEEVENLPRFYERKAREYRQLSNKSEE